MIVERSLAPGALIDPARVMAELRQHGDAGLTRQVQELVPYAEARWLRPRMPPWPPGSVPVRTARCACLRRLL